MLSVVIPTRNSEDSLALTLASLVPAAADGFVREVVIVDAGSKDQTEVVADVTGCTFLRGEEPLGVRLARGASEATRGNWLLFLRPGVILEAGWHREVASLIERLERSVGKGADQAIVFRFALDALGPGARLSEWAVAVARGITGVPHCAQGLLISREHYRRLGGHRPLPVMEDVDIFRRIGRSRWVTARAKASIVASAWPGEMQRGIRRSVSRTLAALAIPPRFLVRLHGLPAQSSSDTRA
ncbi:putative glucosyl-3-phosphoglycerate synthase [Hartmannibacter diazotrophicus]|uniref:Putative glucosyl-3-phosphoglycerate synthase n=1 Tax=Hartmannibacter diazotrophicus TaxID=1482074 RepID=A0A2C9D345_9HYPH|nr:glycosyltransferase [Hartmannibacter diazotrophicus]SON54686.1 putative glucosyl-3-phosphoglycerate synthase [Hartmannibacter diazotrophicus]